MSKKITQSKLIQLFEHYNLELKLRKNYEIFKNKIPDGYIILDDMLCIFECKPSIDLWNNKTKKQILEYIELSEEYCQRNSLDIIPVFVYGTDSISLKIIEDFDKDPTDMIDFEECFLKDLDIETSQSFSKVIHSFNQFVYENFKSISSNERLYIIISVLITKHFNHSETLTYLDCLNTERNLKMIQYFKFISDEPYNIVTNKCIDFFKNINDNQILIILFESFNEISKYSFKLEDGKDIKKQLTQDNGAVLTPPDIVSLMISELDITLIDSVLDPCCGTGNFLLEALNYTTKVFGNELDLNRCIIAKHGLLIKNNKESITNIDCMKNSYKPSFDYLLFNPPYNKQKEQEFVIKFIKLAKKGGTVIIPVSNFRDSNFQNEILKICKPLKLILLNNKVFHPICSVQTAILIFSKNIDDITFKLYDFRDDGYEIKLHKSRVFNELKEPIFIRNIVDNDWINIEQETISKVDILKYLRDNIINRICSELKELE